MASAILVDFPREAGWRLLDLLDAADFNFQINAAFWRYEEEPEEWRLYLASPRVGSDGPSALYERIQPLLGGMSATDRGDLDLQDIILVTPDALVVREVKQRYGAVQGRRGAVVRRTSLARDEAFIYRL